ncbi:Glyoxalase-like domain [Nocardia amikacinitolerans]|uniref:glyoxalase/bleomycin resistance/extradiol dioxygenase family protein n=1 Tax=Nocardia amikacinitolerans TaxID=756689 RepID=UPI0008337872|nr:glyoxalase/bleomycin resistance/extradiol dioxygenase family protein [Nocardia amikacinitolerans]MCP2320719.1 Glyoxalase-like domain [Nocardia amikacinitolerans]
MSIVLNHTIVRAADKAAAATFFAELMGLTVGAPTGPFLPVRLSADLTFDFDDRGAVTPQHYGFLVDDERFDAVLSRLQRWPDVRYGSGPERGWDRRINRLAGGRGVYVLAPDGHSYELFTAVP